MPRTTGTARRLLQGGGMKRLLLVHIFWALPARAAPSLAPRETPRASRDAEGSLSAAERAAPVEHPVERPVEREAAPFESDLVGCHRTPKSKRFRWNVRGEVGVQELVASLGPIGCETIVVGPQAAARGGKVMIEVPDLLTASEVYRLFYAALEALGLTVERSGHALQIVDAARAREVSTVEAGGAPAPVGGAEFVTRLLRVAHAPAAELAEVVGKLRTKEGDVAAYHGALIVTDRAANVARIESLARALDVAEPGQRIYTVATHGQGPSDVAAALEKILGATKRPTDAKAAAGVPLADGVVALVPVDGARLVAVVGNDDGFRHVQSLVQAIDPPTPDGAESQAHVLRLANTNAEDIAATLKDAGMVARPAPTKGAPPSMLAGEVRIAPDKLSNTLVVFAGAADFALIRDLVAQLDVPRRQVYVEATILDLSVDRARALGIAFHQGASNGSTSGFVASGGSGLNSIDVNASTVASALSGGGLVAGVIGSSFKIFGQDVPSFGVMLQALEHQKDVNVISRPHLLTMDNVPAALSVGQSIPFPTGSLATQAPGATTAVALQTTYSRQDVSLKMEIKPHLNDSDSIRLELDGEISDVADSGQTAGGPITNKRTLKTAVVVRDGDTVVLGGLQKDEEGESVEKIPVLGDIPLLGRLFKHTTKTHTKQDLLIILTPYVIRGPADLRRIAERKEAERVEFEERSTAFRDESRFDAQVDYRRKRGLLEEINTTAQAAAREAQAVQTARELLRTTRTDGPVVED
jgi:general secretion pathway protein D